MRTSGLLLLASLLCAASAAAEVLDSSPSGFTLENKVTVPVDAKTAWRGLVDHVGDWWPSDHTWWGKASNLSIEARAGGCFCERNGKQQAEHMHVVMVMPGQLLRLKGALGPLQGMGLDGALEFRFKQADDGKSTEITMWFRNGGYTPDDLSKFVPVVDAVQKQQLGGLKTFLER
jgi:uncharacterized protein YndB with AHSA1/START domain